MTTPGAAGAPSPADDPLPEALELARGAASPVDVIADLGSGNAKIPRAMCPLLPGATRVCAVEMSREMLAIAARNRAVARSFSFVDISCPRSRQLTHRTDPSLAHSS